jgi:hypothetical protein
MVEHVISTKETKSNSHQSTVLRQSLYDIAKRKNWSYVLAHPNNNLHQRIIACTQKNVLIDQIKDAIQPFAFWQTLNDDLQKQNMHVTVVTDNVVEWNQLSHIKFIFHPCLIGHKVVWSDFWQYIHVTKNQPSRLFNCFMSRIDSVRQSWFYKLYLNQLLDKGYVSCLMYQTQDYRNDITDIELFDYIHYNHGLSQLKNFHQAYLELKCQIPYVNFVENNQLWDKILDSKYSVVLDTAGAMDNEDCWYFSEKVVRALTCPTHELLFVQKGLLEKLESWGFLLNPQQNYDNLGWIERFDAMIEILKHDDTDYNFLELKHRAMHNIDIMHKWLFNIDDLFEQIYDL